MHFYNFCITWGLQSDLKETKYSPPNWNSEQSLLPRLFSLSPDGNFDFSCSSLLQPHTSESVRQEAEPCVCFLTPKWSLWYQGTPSPSSVLGGCFSLESVQMSLIICCINPLFLLFLQRFGLLGQISHVNIDIINIDIIWSSLDDIKKWGILIWNIVKSVYYWKQQGLKNFLNRAV